MRKQQAFGLCLQSDTEAQENTVYLWSLLLVAIVHRTTTSAIWGCSVVKLSKYNRDSKGFFPFITSSEIFIGTASVGCHAKANVLY